MTTLNAGGRLARVGLETSLKPFTDWSPATVESTVAQMFELWAPLIERADSIAVLLWVADGSEILDWDGDEERVFDWGSSVGFSNLDADPYGHNVTADRAAVPYRSDIQSLSYRDLRRVVGAIKEVGARLTGKPVSVGATFDAGPEFARSEFKYHRHPEIVARGEDDGIGKLIRMVNAGAVLDGDDRRYAAFPSGIPEGTTFGTFLGGQSQAFLADMGFDYLWLSNGFGFSAYSWTPLGATFDGRVFDPSRGAAVSQRMLDFWSDFSAVCSYPVEVRGTNFSIGIDIGSDAVPADEIYRLMKFRNPPPNSPWGPLNNDFGIELSGYLSRIAEVPSDGFMFRFYVNDPWFWQNPWRDFYNREPFDIHLPLSVSRIDAGGRTQTAQDVQLLSIDTESGELDERTSREVAGHIGQALEDGPDGPGPFVWLYPFDEYHRDVSGRADSLADPYFEDSYLTAAISAGLPLNTVLSTGALDAALASGILRDRVVVAPTRSLTDAVLDGLVAAGVSVLAYGPIRRAGARLASVLEIENVEPLSGDLELFTELASDSFDEGAAATALRHEPGLSGGPITETLRADAIQAEVVAYVCADDETRAYAVSAIAGTAVIAWVRGSAVFEEAPIDHNGLRTPAPHDPSRYLESGSVLRRMLSSFGFEFGFHRRSVSSRTAVQTVHTHANAFWVSGYLADTTTRVRYRFPEGVPLFPQQDCWYNGQSGEYQFGRSFRHEARVFVSQASAAILSCREIAPFPYGMTRGLEAKGLTSARVIVRLPDGAVPRFTVCGEDVAPEQTGRPGEYLLREVSGSVVITWR